MFDLGPFLQIELIGEAFFAEVVSPGLFFVDSDFELIFEKPLIETVTWEIFRGQLLDARHTREQHTFSSYHIRLKSSQSGEKQPLLTIRLPGPADIKPPKTLRPPSLVLHVTRWLHCHVWEAFDDNGAIGSREARRFVEELVGSICLNECGGIEDLKRELKVLIFYAFVGLSRLPLNSVEAPLPVFSLGRVGYFPDLKSGVFYASNPQSLLQRPTEVDERYVNFELKRLELFLRNSSTSELVEGARFVAQLMHAQGEQQAVGQLRRLFNEVSLTPYTDFVDKALTFAKLLFKQSALSTDAYADFLTGLIRQTGYHLTAYDLVTFHHYGANYPDALLLDALLRALLTLANNNPSVLSSLQHDNSATVGRTRRYRRALLLGWCMYRSIEGLPVPDEPTSPGENARVLPAPHLRVPDEQLQQRGRRTRHLFAESPIDWHSYQPLLEICLEELAQPEMLRELGTALYLDRPFGSSKLPAEVDLTPLLSYELFSRSVAHDQLKRMAGLEPLVESKQRLADAVKQLDELRIPGLQVPGPARTSPTVKLQDCWRVADDFVIRRPTPQTIRQIRECFAWEAAPAPFHDWQERGLMPIPVPGASPPEPTRIVFYTAEFLPEFECRVAAEHGFQRRGALELPKPGLVAIHHSVRTTVASQFPAR